MRVMSVEQAPLVPAAALFEGEHSSLVPVDAYQRDGFLIVRCDLPGVDPETIEVCMQPRLVAIQGERDEPTGGEVLLSELPHGVMYRSLDLPVEVDVDQALADFDGGVLTVTAPILEQVSAPCNNDEYLPPTSSWADEPLGG